MSLLIETRQSGEGRGIVVTGAATQSPASTPERWIAPVREALAPRSTGSTQQVARDIGLPREPLVSRGGIGALIPSVGSSALPQRRYEGDDPFSVLADLYASIFGGDNATAGTTQFSVVPQTVGGGSGNTAMILIVLALAGVGIWWFYFRKQGASE